MSTPTSTATQPTAGRHTLAIPVHRRRADLLRGLAALLLLAVTVIGVPALLLTLTGMPFAGGFPDWHRLATRITAPDDGSLLLDTLTVLTWTGWLLFTAATALELISMGRGRLAPILPGLAGLQVTASRLVATASLLLPAMTSSHLPPLPAAALLATAIPTVVAAADTTIDQQPAHPTAAEASQRLPAAAAATTATLVATRLPVYIVGTDATGQRDTLWSIAERHLGDPLRWKDIANLNYGQPQPDGDKLTDPGLIRNGWQLRLPADATGLPTTAPSDTARSRVRQPTKPPTSKPATTKLPTAPTPATPNPAARPAPTAPTSKAPTRTPVALPPLASVPPPTVAPPAPPTAAPTSMPSPPPVQGSPTPPAIPTPPTAIPTRPSSPTTPMLPTGFPTAPPPARAESSPYLPPIGPSTPAVRQLQQPAQPTASVRFGLGSEISTALAAAIVAALTLTRLRRRHRHRPGHPRPARLSGHPATPPPIRQLLAANTRPQPAARPPSNQPALDSQPHWTPPPTGRLGYWDLAVRGQTPISPAWTDYPVLHISGPAAGYIARVQLLAALTAHEGTVDILVAADLTSRLLPDNPAGLQLRQLPNTTTLSRALDAELLGRRRRLADADLPTAADYRQEHPEDPLPALLVLTDALPRGLEPANLAGLDVGVLLVGQAHSADGGALLQTGPGGAIEHAQPQDLAQQLDGAQLYRLTATDAQILLTALYAEDDTGADASGTADDAGDAWTAPGLQAGTVATGSPVLAGPANGDAPTKARPLARIRVQLFGPVRIWVDGTEITRGLREAGRELLAWYLLHPSGRSADTAITALWPDSAPKQGQQRFWSALSSLRQRLQPDRSDKPILLAKTGGIYRPVAEELNVDLWTFQNALQAAAASSATDRIAALQQAVNAYTGDLAQEGDYLWVDPYREELHRRGVDAYIILADSLSQAGESDRAANTLERLLTLDPHGEPGYRRLMQLHGQAGRIDAVHRLYRQLTSRLDQLREEPASSTRRTYRQLTQSTATAQADHASAVANGR